MHNTQRALYHLHILIIHVYRGTGRDTAVGMPGTYNIINLVIGIPFGKLKKSRWHRRTLMISYTYIDTYRYILRRETYEITDQRYRT